MSDQPETIAAILADFRKFALRAAEEDKTISPESVLLLADKVEAAINLREHNLCVMLATKRRDLDTVIRENEAIRDQLDNLIAAHEYDRRALVDATSPGNAAAMREALTAFVDCIQWICDGDERGIFKKQFAPLLSESRAALAAPARNCDRFATAAEAALAFNADTKTKCGEEISPRLLAWLFDKAKGGDHA